MQRPETGNDRQITARLQSFYERHPYPPPVADLAAYARRWADDGRRRAESSLLFPAEAYRDDRSILIAGCGTSQAAKYAVRWPRANVTGIDLSQHSIAATQRLKDKHGLDNLRLVQLPVEQVSELGETYDLVVSTGVLHHLADPDAGLGALRDVLRPAGVLHIMVYAPFGRAGVYMLQRYCQLLGIGPSKKEIRTLAAALGQLPADHPLAPLLRNAPDFASEAGLADAILHPRDRAYSVPEFLAFVARADLALARWTRQAPYLPGCGMLATSPHSHAIRSLPVQNQYAAAELFRGTMVRHSAILTHAKPSAPGRGIDFQNDVWLEHVPIRLPDTIAVEERLPEGAAAVLINRNHTFTDLYLPVDQREKEWVEAIDSAKSIGEIIGASKHHEAARDLFRRLWQYDQVVFDASRSRRSPPAR